MRKRKMNITFITLLILTFIMIYSIHLRAGQQQDTFLQQNSNPAVSQIENEVSQNKGMDNGIDNEQETMKYILHPQIPVLMYHVVEDVPDSNSLFLSPEHFQEHLDYFQSAGIHPVTMKDVYNHWHHEKPLPEKPIVLSFDDGYRSMYTEVWPRLQEKHWPGVFYIYTKAVGQDTNLTVEMIREMSGGGMEIGSHSVSHLDMSTLSDDGLKPEIEDSKEYLEQITGQPVESFCYPSGRYNDTVKQRIQQAGYHTAVTTQYGVAENTEDSYELSRIRISKGDNGQVLEEKLKAVNEW